MVKNKIDSKALLQYVGAPAIVGVLLLGFQNCGMQLVSEDELNKASADTYQYDENLLTRNSDGTYSFPLPGENSGNGSGSSGGGGNLNLGGGGSGGGGSGSGGGYDPYDNDFRKSSLYPGEPRGTQAFSKRIYSFNRLEVLQDGVNLWRSYSSAISSWNQQQMGTEERKSLIVVAMKELSVGTDQVTYGLTGTSLCHKFSGTVVADISSKRHYYTIRSGGSDGYDDLRSYFGHGYTFSGASVTPKSQEELTQLESAGCDALGGYDRRALNSFLHVLTNFRAMEPVGNDLLFQQKGILNHYSGWSTQIRLVPFTP